MPGSMTFFSRNNGAPHLVGGRHWRQRMVRRTGSKAGVSQDDTANAPTHD
jgi:hypothetical protein